MIDLNNPEFADVDPLKEKYSEAICEIPFRESITDHSKIALLVIDMQYLDAAEGYGVFSRDDNGVPKEAREYYFKTLKEEVVPNIRKLQDTFRKHSMEIIHTRIQCLTMDGRDRSPGHKRLGLIATPGSREADFLEEVAPQGDEIIINKTASGVFNASNIHYILRNMGISALYVAGVYTNECVSTTIRDGSDLGFSMTLIEDATTTVTPTLQENTVSVLRDRYARIVTTNDAIDELNKYMENC